jgi:hypothetical protein
MDNTAGFSVQELEIFVSQEFFQILYVVINMVYGFVNLTDSLSLWLAHFIHN